LFYSPSYHHTAETRHIIIVIIIKTIFIQEKIIGTPTTTITATGVVVQSKSMLTNDTKKIANLNH